MRKFDFLSTNLIDLAIVQRKSNEDTRGFLSRFYCSEELCEVGFSKSIVQINHTLTCRKGTVRGMHFQYSPHAEIKLVSCLQGEIFDVAVDLRRDSSTFLNWHGEILSANNRKSLLIPEGFAHGFQTMTNDCELFYLHTAAYHAKAEGALNATDPKLGIAWPLTITDMSEKDRNHQLIEQNFKGIIV